VLWKVKDNPAVTTSGNIITQTPMFDSVDTDKHFYDFRLKKGSPAEDKGTNTSITLDLDGKPRWVHSVHSHNVAHSLNFSVSLYRCALFPPCFPRLVISISPSNRRAPIMLWARLTLGD